jgi:hypothetical protein
MVRRLSFGSGFVKGEECGKGYLKMLFARSGVLG